MDASQWTSGLTRRKAFTLRGGNGDVEIVDSPIDERDLKLRDFEALVAPRRTGICGSDLHFYMDGGIGSRRLQGPMVLGHEASGVVLAVGSRVAGLSPGDLVALEPGESCGTCELCKGGRYELCGNMVFAASPPYHGTLQTVYKLPAHLCYKLPEGISLDHGALMEPLSVAVHAVSKVGSMKANQNVAVFGCGPVGLLVMAVCEALGARRIIGIDVQPERLAFAQSYVDADVYLPPKRSAEESAAAYATRSASEMAKSLGIPIRGLEAIDLVVECSGAEICIQTAAHIAKAGGTIVQVGMGSNTPGLPLIPMITKELKYCGSFRYGPGVYQTAIDLVAQGKISLGPLITHQYSFQDAKKAFEAMVKQKGYDGKPPIKITISGPEWEGGNKEIINKL